MGNKRGLKRWHLIYYLRVFESGSEQLLGHVVDITTEGLMLISEKRIPFDREFDLRMEIPNEDGGKRNFTMKALSVWSDRDVNRSFYDTGFELVDPTPDTIEQIQMLIDELHFDGKREIIEEEAYL